MEQRRHAAVTLSRYDEHEMRVRWLMLLAVAACGSQAPEPLPTMVRRPAPPEPATGPRCSTEAIEAGYIGDQLWLCAATRADMASWQCAAAGADGEVLKVGGLLWDRAPERRTAISPEVDAEWDEAGNVTLRDRATGDAVQSARLRIRTTEVDLSVVDGLPVMLRGWNVGGCDLLLHFGGRY
jgi:hypothetical protein